MKAKDLKKLLQPLLKAVPNSTLPALGHIAVVDGVFVADNLEIRVSVPVPEDVDVEGEGLIPAYELGKILVAAKDDVVNGLKFQDKEAVLVVGGRDFGYETPGLADFSSPRTYVHYDVFRAETMTKIRACAAFTGNDDLRLAMTGVGLTSNGIAATNTHYLRFYHQPKFGCDYIIPAKAVPYLPEGDYVAVGVSDKAKFLRFVGGDGYAVDVMLIDAKFPDWPGVISTDTKNHTTITVNRKDLLRSVALAALQANATTSEVRLEASMASLTLTAYDHDFGKTYKDVVDAKAAALPVFAVSAKLLEHCLKHGTGDDVVITHTGSAARAVLIDDDLLLMPVMMTETKWPI